MVNAKKNNDEQEKQLNYQRMQLVLHDIVDRNNYLIVKSNDLAGAFAALGLLEHKILNYALTDITPKTKKNDVHTVNMRDVCHNLNMRISGSNYELVGKAFHRLFKKTPLYVTGTKADGTEFVRMFHLFSFVEIQGNGLINFKFSDEAIPYIFDLKKRFYCFHLSDLSQVKSKHAMRLMELWAKFGKTSYSEEENEEKKYSLPNYALIQGTVEEFQAWFLGYDDEEKPKTMLTKDFNKYILDVAIKEVGKMYPNFNFELEKVKAGRKIIGYRINIVNTEYVKKQLVHFDKRTLETLDAFQNQENANPDLPNMDYLKQFEDTEIEKAKQLAYQNFLESPEYKYYQKQTAEFEREYQATVEKQNDKQQTQADLDADIALFVDENIADNHIVNSSAPKLENQLQDNPFASSQPSNQPIINEPSEDLPTITNRENASLDDKKRKLFEIDEMIMLKVGKNNFSEFIRLRNLVADLLNKKGDISLEDLKELGIIGN